ncbi:probable ATP-dependent RNA helicase Dbp73D [Microplitis mediator]|uniref:probable ATP-dependent RNA helicase Dbp73D n=1 Tax=Microplitis mediator TaxID=375433 RepID=UPI0025539AC2|nr:probable ATP-dependent RNA helicase Dbp73D [Microplitis mediator]
MSLFEVRRYDEENEQETKSYDHLSELFKLIEERKQQRLNIINKNNNNENNDNKKKLQKKRKRKLDIEIVKESNEIENNNVNDNDNNNDNVNDNENTVDESKHKQDFMILGANASKKKSKVTRVLPKWLTHPEIISADLNNGPELDDNIKESLNLDDQMMKTLQDNGIKKLFPVQLNVIKWMLKCNEYRRMGWWPRDTCVSAPTGSGKTLAYVLPIIQQLKNNLITKVRCLIVLPVQELAAQVYKVMITYCKNTNLRVALITGASSMEIEQTNLIKKTQNGDLISRVDIVISTPGRLIDHIEKTKGFTLNYLEYLVIDEADRSTDWLKYIPHPHYNIPSLTIKNIQSCSIPPAQKLLFSATLSQDPEKLSRLNLFQPILFTSVVLKNHDNDEDIDLDNECGEFLGKYTSPTELTERSFECSSEYKPIAAWKLITDDEKSKKTLIFTNSGNSAHRLALLLGFMLADKNICVDELSSQMTPKQRGEVLDKFSKADSGVLVSSDALARGVDIPNVTVISYDLPKNIKGYIHRSGRTGRAGKLGTAISILTCNQIPAFKRMLASAHKVVPTIEKFESLETIAEDINYIDQLSKLKEIISKEEIKNNKVTKSNDKKNKKKFTNDNTKSKRQSKE